MHYPEELAIESYGSGYGGNALLGKKCHALRIASYQARTEGWLAEHMLIVGLQNPARRDALRRRGVSVGLRQDQPRDADSPRIAAGLESLHRRAMTSPGSIPGRDGRLWAINPEAGYFGVVPGTNAKTNRNAYEMIRHDTLFTNVAVTADNEPWWEGRKNGAPVIDWQGRPYDPAQWPGRTSEFALHRRGHAEPELCTRRRGSARRADFRADLRWTPARAGAARL